MESVVFGDQQSSARIITLDAAVNTPSRERLVPSGDHASDHACSVMLILDHVALSQIRTTSRSQTAMLFPSGE
jgi:hypothetical protein